MSATSKILIIGATGYIRKHIAEASFEAGHPTVALVRKRAVFDPEMLKLIENFKNSEIKLHYGDLHDKGILLDAIKQVDVVISARGESQIPDQMKLIAAIKEAGNI
ncbi:isoflavone reductase-like protein [Quillaja saponaria]|uniref:Isoflavone reductase-like protein n=1 Tax=Quillaja saponaria TaxID=32244 RepID=A0AAD7KSQ1_QUISA|nr:isoflavone reductase-like protein [Quillaja saponaria]